jgi:5-methylcytosine-specific restriction endonuclease McrA
VHQPIWEMDDHTWERLFLHPSPDPVPVSRCLDEFCSWLAGEGAQRHAELQAMPYWQYLETPEWQVSRQDALERARYKCQLCGARGVMLHVHHNTYRGRGQERPEDLLALCADCHRSHHGR